MWYMVIHSTIYVLLCNSPAEVEERLEKGEEMWYMVIHSTIYVLYATHRLK